MESRGKSEDFETKNLQPAINIKKKPISTYMLLFLFEPRTRDKARNGYADIKALQH
jgi:hypothetical protein